jgi:hypothetical protein
MPRSQEETRDFIVQMALRRALKVVRGLRKQITDLDERVMTTELLRQLHIGQEVAGRTFCWLYVRTAGRSRRCEGVAVAPDNIDPRATI